MLSNGPYCRIGTWGEAWRNECEARYFLSLHLSRRQEELNDPKRAGRVDQLKAEIRRQWEENKNRHDSGHGR